MSWEIGKSYSKEIVVSYDGYNYKCVQPHTSQSDWYPCIDTLSLWVPTDSDVTSLPGPTPKPTDNGSDVPNPLTPKPTDNGSDVPNPLTPKPTDNGGDVPNPLTPKPTDNGGESQPTLSPNTRALNFLLKNNVPYGTYFESWRSTWVSKGSEMDLANIPPPINIVYLSFASPTTLYKKGQNSWAETGMSFSQDFAVVKDAISVLVKRGIVVMLSVGGATYPFTKYNASNLADLCNDLGCHGIDIDWEDEHDFGRFTSFITETRKYLPNKSISCATFSVGAYGQGEFVNAQPPSSRTGMNIQGFKEAGKELDWVNIMSYDAGLSFSPIESFKAHQSWYNGPLLLGFEVPPEAWGGHVITLDKVKEQMEFVKTQNSIIKHGAFVWSYQKQGSPSCMDMLTISAKILGLAAPTPAPNPAPTPTPKPEPKPLPTPTKEASTILAPYLYTWGFNNSVYKINKCMDLMNIGGNAVTIAFVTNDSVSDIINTFRQDFMQFKEKGGQLIISFGGANGPYMEDVLSEDNMFNEVSKLIDSTGCNALDFDIEGAYTANNSLNIKRAKIIKRLQDKYPELYISFTLPADPNGLSGYGVGLLQTTVQNNVSINIINIMAMDIGRLPNNQSWGLTASRMGDTTVNQMKTIWPSKSTAELYRMLGITTMIGKNDDDSIFLPNDATILADYARKNNIGLLSYWSINRDQVGKGELGIYSQHNNSNFEYFNNMKSGLGMLGVLPNADGKPVANDTWKVGNKYKVGDVVVFGGREYKYVDQHTASDANKPSNTPTTWALKL
ncbi:MAG: glycosyl hydrolase family 18 protein [Cetobacterium sp.]